MVLHSHCPLCKQGGRVGVRVASDGQTLVLVCDECAHVWMRPDRVDEEHAIDPLATDFARHYPGLSLSGSRWATPDQVLAYGWGAYVTALAARPHEEEGPGVHQITPDE